MASKISCLLILAVLVLCPFAANAEADFATEGMVDPELDAVRHTSISFDSAADVLLTQGLLHIVVVTAVVHPVDDVAVSVETRPPRQPRAPPLS